VGAAERGALERLTRQISLTGDLLASPSGLDWTEHGLLEEAWRRPLLKLVERGRLKLDEAFANGTFANANRWGEAISLTPSYTFDRRGTGSKVMLLVDGHGTPLGALAASASLGETTLLESLLDLNLAPREPRRLIYDRALDSVEHRRQLPARGIELVCPHCKNRTRPRLQDGRPLRRFRRRWKIERSNSWAHKFRRFFTRHDRLLLVYEGFVLLTCLLIVLRRF
jgi:transposase